MKNKIAIASAFIAASSFSTAEIVINDFLSFEGFVDMSYTHTDSEDFNGAESNENSYQVDQVEISWLFNFDTVTAQVDIDAEGSNGSNGDDVFDDSDSGSGLSELEIEQAFVNYALGNGDVITAGRYASMLGFEAFEPTGLYQYSTAYVFFDNIEIGTPGYAQGVKYTSEGDNTFFGISLQDSVSGDYADNLGGPDGGWGVEVAGAYYMDNGLSFFLGGAFEDDNETGDAYVINSYVTYETGAWIFAAELNYGEEDPDGAAKTDGVSGLLMANFAYSDVASVTGRVSFYDQDNAGTDEDGYALTLAHGYAFTDNLLLVTEVSYGEEDRDGAVQESEVLFGAVELLFTF